MATPSHSRSGLRRLATLVLVLAVALVAGGWRPAHAADYVVYGDGLASGWSNWSWGSSVSFNTGGAFSGSYAIAWQIWNPWGGLYLHTDSAVQTNGGTSLQLTLMASQWNQRLSVAVYGEGGWQIGARPLSEFGGDPAPWQWKTYTVPLSRLGAAGQRISGIALQDATGAAQPTLRVDEVKLTGVSGGSVTVAQGSANCLGVPAYPEIRWENAAQNSTRGRPTNPGAFFGHSGWRWYYDRVDGACTGTTEQILEWAARKWGFDQLGYPDLAKAMATLETWWRQSFVGHAGEVGILQIHPSFWPDWGPAVWSTAYAADYAMAVIRSYYDGASWLGDATRGNLRDSVAAWYCGCPYNGWSDYPNWVFRYLETKPWKRPGQPPEWF